MSENRDEQGNSKVIMSRRGFLKAGGLAMGSALLAGGGSVGLTGCSGSEAGSSTSSTGTGTPTYRVYDSDILFIGSGFGAMSAVTEAMKNNRKITVVDKGPFRASGGIGMNWDVEYVWYPLSADGKGIKTNYMADSVLNRGRGVNQQAIKNADLSDPNRSDLQFYGNTGCECFPRRNADGSLKYMMKYSSVYMIEGGFPRHLQDEVSKSSLVTIYDLTMITDLLINDGVCVGAMGVYLPTGDLCVYRANAVVLATGGSSWFHGWNTVSANTMNVPDNTADVDMAAYRHGARVGDAEYGSYDLISISPKGIAYAFNSGIGADANENAYICDKDGTYFLQELSATDQTRILRDRPFFNQIIGKRIADGYGTTNGGLYVDLRDPTVLAKIRIAYSRNATLWKNNFGIDVSGELLELGLEMYEHGGTPVIDANMMSDIPGLFCVRGAGIMGSGGGTTQYLNTRMGSYTLRSALAWLKTATAPKVDLTPAVTEYTRLHEMRTRTVGSGGLRPHVVRQRIQKACACMSVVRPTAALEAASTELARIRKEDLPNQVCSDKSLIYNTEWKMAIENYNMIELAEMAVNATLMRQESRGHYRPEYPTQDDTNWDCMIAAKLTSGTMAFEKVTFDKVSWDDVADTFV
ncbi:FAD-binding protein [Geobacter sp. FeAm09]|uniref:FAD-dependent oxidoreductase n=1 Tax=Geobacter sp. FeAm09 TaxID=2597769 RepID=UPI0011F0481B|nr:FAD-binding protein [Geobacter sp. FeAm09]QEM68763.1 FAD-binding protein [Geobacter sp. FeAm09]